MTEINEIIKREVNPFDLINFKSINFWAENQNTALTVESIHKEALNEIEELLDLVAIDHRSRTALLLGDSGSGKSYLLGRIKRTLNTKAFFAYIQCNWADSGNIWRHILRHTVDSLVQIPEGQQDSQLMLWLKSLSAFTKRNLKNQIFNDSIWQLLQNDRQKFIKHLKETYRKANIYNPDIFFGVLHDLTDPELYDLACEWLRGDDLSEESMQMLKVKICIDTEDAAKNILANFGRISTETQPIVLCFDNLDSMPPLSDGYLDIQPFFNVNTTIHSDYLKNFLVIISVITSTWKRNIDRIQPADRAGIHRLVKLKNITLDQAEAIWAYNLKPIHQEASIQPDSPIFPLTRQVLEQHFPGGKTMPRNTLILGRQEYQKYKISIKPPISIDVIPLKKTKLDPEKVNISIIRESDGTVSISPLQPQEDTEKIAAEFQLLWQKEYRKIQEKYTKITLLSSSDLIRMLQEALTTFKIHEIKPKLLSGKYASYSFSYHNPGKLERIGIVWTEDLSMRNFYNVMSACQNVIQKKSCQILYLIRIGGVGTPRLAGNQIYQQIFTHTSHHHIKPNLNSVHYLATYQSLVNSALSQDLVLTSKGKAVNLQELQSLIRDTKILHSCTLLQDLKIVNKQKTSNGKGEENLQPVKEFLLNIVRTQGFMGLPTLVKQSIGQFPDVKETDVKSVIQLLCQDKEIQIINPEAGLQDQLICLVA
ncbi:ATP-binding protein [Anabaena subtropica]|uniref:ATP-binding protein n=1 Tax=Anabaena subtropica FACHB-260 TaxID=2692884 RepID=A0ABR8CU63_9NOST|nr:ATP-binding protein [Anabaena subtropica]MBD2345330.1 ATP-binding protein [Anabaena subtropica FACHB-260]